MTAAKLTTAVRLRLAALLFLPKQAPRVNDSVRCCGPGGFRPGALFFCRSPTLNYAEQLALRIKLVADLRLPDSVGAHQ
jgi:hypothetical protein